MPSERPARTLPIEQMQDCPKPLSVSSGDPLEALSVGIGNLRIHAQCEGWRQTLIKWIRGGVD